MKQFFTLLISVGFDFGSWFLKVFGSSSGLELLYSSFGSVPVSADILMPVRHYV